MKIDGAYHHYNEFHNLIIISNKVSVENLILWMGNNLNYPFIQFSAATLLSGAKTGKFGKFVLPVSAVNITTGNSFIMLSHNDDLTVFKLAFPYDNVEEFNKKLVDDLSQL